MNRALHSSRTFAVLTLLSVLLLAVLAAAQTTSRVAGVLQDSSGALISGAQVILTDEATGVSFTGETTSAGMYVFDAVKPGTYREDCEEGFQTL